MYINVEAKPVVQRALQMILRLFLFLIDMILLYDVSVSIHT